jgi:hypothetical protein
VTIGALIETNYLMMASALIANAAYPTIFVGHGSNGIAFDSANYLLFGGISYKKK